MDVKDLETPTYTTPTASSTKEKVTLKVRRFPGQKPMKIKVDPSWTVRQVEGKLADALGTSRRTARLHLNGRPLSKNATIRSLMPQIQDSVLEVVPEHPVGARIKPGLPFYLSPKRYRCTDFARVRAELLDLPYKPGYGKTFKAEVKSAAYEDLLYPILKINFRGRWYPFQLVLVGYPHYSPTGYFKVIPTVRGGRHPHVFSDGRPCYGIEENWTPGMMLFEDYIQFLFRLLGKTTH